MTFELVIRGGTILTMDEGYHVLQDHIIGIDKGHIKAIFPAAASSYKCGREINASGCLVLPGLINGHSHLAMTYFRGLADDMPLMEWLRGYIWPLEGKLVKPRFVYDATLHGAAEMLKNGISTTNDMYFCMDSVADACSQAGLRVIISEALLEHKVVQDEGLASIGTSIKLLNEHYRHDPLISFSLAPHSIYTCSQNTLKRCAEVAAKENILLHMHLSETRDEVETCQKEHGQNPVEYVRELGYLDTPIIFAHGVWMDEKELELLADSKCSSIAVCTESNLKLCSGFAPLKAYLDKGINVCLGTDGVASNNNLDLLAELSLTTKLHKALNNDPTFLPAKDALAMVTRDAARALGRGDELGTLEEGKLADICILDLHRLENQPLYNPYSQVVYALGSGSVRDMIVQGRQVLKNGKVCNVDEEKLMQVSEAYRQRILSELEQ